jgi:hypothetical protein
MKKKNFLFAIIMALLFSVMNQFANAQVIYTDIPDVTISTSGAMYPLDLNNDNVADFNLSFSLQSYKSKNCNTISLPSGNILSLSQNKVLTTQTANPNSFYPTALNVNSNISRDSNTWKGSSLVLFSHNNVKCILYSGSCLEGICGYDWTISSEGQWAYTIDKCLGLKIHVGSNDYYGWVRLSTSGNGVTIKDYAYYATPSHSIFAGQSTTEYIIFPTANLNGCSGSNMAVSYNAYGNFSTSNIFSAELSDANGSFSNPVVIGTLNSMASGRIDAALPVSVGSENGTYYEIRIKSKTPIRTSNENNISISTVPNNIFIESDPSSIGNSVILNCSGYLYVFNNAAYGTSQWKKGGIDILGANGSVYNPVNDGDYSCGITNSCGTKISNIIHTTVYPCPSSQRKKETFIQEENKRPSTALVLKIYPNPVSNTATVSFSIPQSGNVSFKLFDIQGRLAKTITNRILEPGEQQIVLNTENMKPGIYLLKMESKNYSVTKKIVIVK